MKKILKFIGIWLLIIIIIGLPFIYPTFGLWVIGTILMIIWVYMVSKMLWQLLTDEKERP